MTPRRFLPDTFGAIGDGSTDAGPALRAADVYLAARGGELFVPPGTYLIGTHDANSWSFNATSENVTLIGGSSLRDWSKRSGADNTAGSSRDR